MATNAELRVAPVLMTLAGVLYGVVPPLVDIDVTHVFHPAWPGHARFHLVWALTVNTALAGMVVLLAWWPGPQRLLRLRIAGVVGTIVLTSFFVAVALRQAYAGALTDEGGVPPVMGMDANVLGFTAALIMQALGFALSLRAGRTVR